MLGIELSPFFSDQRYRCRGCGGRTRFLVKATTSVTYYHHQGIGDGMTPEEVEVTDQAVIEVRCPYCTNGGDIEAITPDEEGEDAKVLEGGTDTGS